MGYGFIEQTINGERAILHGGDHSQSHAILALLPERDVGIFVAYNSYGAGGDSAKYELLQAFMDRYYPEAPTPAPEPFAEGASGNAERVAGSYRITFSNHTGFEKVATFSGDLNVRVSANEDGSITTTGPLSLEGGTERRWVEVGPLLFRAVDGAGRIAFREGDGGRITYLSADDIPIFAYEKVSFYEAPRLHIGVLAGGLVVMVLTALAWPVGALVGALISRYRKRYGRPHQKPDEEPVASAKTPRRARIVAWGVCVLDLLFVTGMVVVLSNMETLFYGVTPSLVAVLTLPILSAVGTAGVLVCAAVAWKRAYWGVLGRLHYSLVALSALTFLAVLGYYNLLGFQF